MTGTASHAIRRGRKAYYAYAYAAKDRRGAVPYCAPTAVSAIVQAVRTRDIARAAAIGKGSSCKEAKKVATKTAIAKASKCPIYRFDYSKSTPDKLAIVDGKGRVIARPARSAASAVMDRLSRKGCPNGFKPTPAEKKIR